MRVLLSLAVSVMVVASCAGSSSPNPSPTAVPAGVDVEEQSQTGPGGYGFDRSDPAGGVENIMTAFAADESTAMCIFDAWGDVSQVPAEELTPELMTYEVCGTSIFQMMTGDGRFTGEGG